MNITPATTDQLLFSAFVTSATEAYRFSGLGEQSLRTTEEYFLTGNRDITIPREYKSLRTFALPPSRTSGAAYTAVPAGFFKMEEESASERPKSMSLTLLPEYVMRMFEGFKSLWRTCRECIYDKAEQISTTILSQTLLSGFPSARKASRVRPSTHSISMQLPSDGSLKNE